MSNVIKRESLLSRTGALLRLRRAWQTQRKLADIQDNQDGDTWYKEERGEDYAYARQHQHSPRQPLKRQQSARQAQAQRAYQSAKNIAEQRVTHAPFYLETLGIDPNDVDPKETHLQSLHQLESVDSDYK